MISLDRPYGLVALREILPDRGAGGIAVDGGRRAEHQIAYPGPFHRLQQYQGAAQVVLVVVQRDAGRLADRLEGGEVDHGVDVLLPEDAIQQGRVTDVPFVEAGLAPADGGDTGQDARLAVAEVVHHHGLHACGLQGQTGVAADVAATAGDQYFHPLFHPQLLASGKPEQESSRGADGQTVSCLTNMCKRLHLFSSTNVASSDFSPVISDIERYNAASCSVK